MLTSVQLECAASTSTMRVVGVGSGLRWNFSQSFKAWLPAAKIHGGIKGCS
jgi:hypothetical protein